jgi:hypothetical protein
MLATLAIKGPESSAVKRMPKLRTVAMLLICILPAIAHAADDRATVQAVSYVFASELGSGVYNLSGRNLQVYRIAPGKQLRQAAGPSPGTRLVLPVTVGFFDFSPEDVLDGALPNSIGSFSITPGIEFDYVLRDDWHLIPYVDAGASFTGSGLDGLLYGAGLRLEHSRVVRGARLETRHEVTFAGVSWQQNLPNEQFLRVRQAVELRHGSGLYWGSRELDGGLYGIFDIILDAPIPPVAGAQRETLQWEVGAMLGTQPAVKMWRFDAPRLGIGYRSAGEFSGWRIVLGRPF